MIDNLKKILNEDQDPKAIEKITAKLENLLMSNEEVGYIAVQKKPAVTIFPDSIVVTNKRIILCKPKNLGLSMEFIDYDWDDISGSCSHHRDGPDGHSSPEGWTPSACLRVHQGCAFPEWNQGHDPLHG
jgi:hypothetical protein